MSGSGTGTEGQQVGKKRYRLDKRLEEVDGLAEHDFTNLKATGKVTDAVCEPDGISWRNDESEGEEKREYEQNAVSHEKEYDAEAIKLHNNIKLVSEKQASFNSSMGNSAMKLMNASVAVSPPKEQRERRSRPKIID